MLALVLLVGAPAVVSEIDKSLEAEIMDEILFDSDNIVIWLRGTNVIADFVIDPTSGQFVVVCPETNFDDHTYIEVLIKSEVITNNKYYTDLFVSVDKPVNRVFAGEPLKWLVLDEETSTYHASYTLGDNLRAMNYPDYPKFRIQLHGMESTEFTLDIQLYSKQTVPYSGFILGGVGVLLLICALFATPWFGFGGIQKKAKARRR